MATPYTGNPAATQAPASAPADGTYPIVNVPDDGDNLNVSSVLQSFKVLADYSAFAQQRFANLPGLRTYDAAATYTAGMAVVDPSDHHSYRVIHGQTSTGIEPHVNLTKWERWGFSSAELAANLNGSFPVTITYPIGSCMAAVWGGPGGISIHVEYLTSADGMLPTSVGTLAHTWGGSAFATNCFGAFFQPSAYSLSHSTGTLVMHITGVTASGCNLTVGGESANGCFAAGWLFSIGN